MRCPHCNEVITNTASVCRFCHGKIERSSKASNATDNDKFAKTINRVLADYPSTTPQTPSPARRSSGEVVTAEGYNNPMPDLYDKLYNSVVEIYLSQSAGSGLFLGRGYIATNAHVILDVDERGNATIPDRIMVLHSGKRYSAKVVNLDPEQDVALIKLTGNYPSALDNITCMVGKCENLRPGDDLFSIGNSMAEGLSFNKFTLKNEVGSYPNSQRYSKYREVIVMNGTAQGGNSGGPVFNIRGEVVGLLTSSPMSFDCLRVIVRDENGSLVGIQPLEVLHAEPGVTVAITVNTLIKLMKETFE